MLNQKASDALFNRRDALQLGAAGALALGGLGIVKRAYGQSCTQNPAQTEGPYWVDEMLSRSDIRSDPGSGVIQPGLPLRMGLTVSETQSGVCSPLPGAYVDVWHCNASGVYSDTAAQGTLGQRFLRGFQVTDAHGNVRFLTIYPGYYQGRTVHIHFRVRLFSGTTTTFNFVSQLYFNDTITDVIFQRVAPYSTRPARNTRNTNDGIYSSTMVLRLADDLTHAIASFNIVVNSMAGLVGPDRIPLEDESAEHGNDFGGGTPPFVTDGPDGVNPADVDLPTPENVTPESGGR